MQWEEQIETDLTILKIKGEIDLNHSPKLRAFFHEKIHAKCPALLIDFSKVNYIDSSGLATLVEYYQGSRPHSGKIVLAAMSPRVKSVFELVRLNEIFSIFDSTDLARQSLASQPAVG